MMSAIRSLIDAVLCMSGAERLFRFRNRKKLLILMYHGVVEERLSPFCWHQLPAKDFKQQLEWIKKNYRVLPLDDALTHLKAGTLPERAACITFDDGFRNNHDVAAPILRDLELPATIFLATDVVGTPNALWPDRVYLAVHRSERQEIDASFLDLGTLKLGSDDDRGNAIHEILAAMKKTPVRAWASHLESLHDAAGLTAEPSSGPFCLMDWDQVRALAAEGFIRFGGHTRTHPILSGLDSADAMRAEIVPSVEKVQNITENCSAVFAYPNGQPGDFDERTIGVLRDESVMWAVTTSEGLASTSSDPLNIPRVSIGSDLAFRRFRLICSGLWTRLKGYVG